MSKIPAHQHVNPVNRGYSKVLKRQPDISQSQHHPQYTVVLTSMRRHSGLHIPCIPLVSPLLSY